MKCRFLRLLWWVRLLLFSIVMMWNSVCRWEWFFCSVGSVVLNIVGKLRVVFFEVLCRL